MWWGPLLRYAVIADFRLNTPGYMAPEKNNNRGKAKAGMGDEQGKGKSLGRQRERERWVREREKGKVGKETNKGR